MSDLPSRDFVRTAGGWEEVKDLPSYLEAILPVLIAYSDGLLKTEAEWREAIDYEAAHDRFDAVVAKAESTDLILVDKIVGNLHSIVDAAIGEA